MQNLTQNEIKGLQGELKIIHLLCKYLELNQQENICQIDNEIITKKYFNKQKNYYLFHNIYLCFNTNNNDVVYTQIDLLFITLFAVYVIEVKNFDSAKIIKNHPENETQWLSDNIPFYSPIKQNQAHIYALKNSVNFYNIDYQSVVVFANSKNLDIQIKENNVIKETELIKYFKNFNTKNFNQKQIYKYIFLLEEAIKNCFENGNIINDHLLYVENRIKNSNSLKEEIEQVNIKTKSNDDKIEYINYRKEKSNKKTNNGKFIIFIIIILLLIILLRIIAK